MNSWGKESNEPDNFKWNIQYLEGRIIRTVQEKKIRTNSGILKELMKIF